MTTYFAEWTDLVDPGSLPFGEQVSRQLAAQAFTDARAERVEQERQGQLDDRADRLEMVGRSTTLAGVFARAEREADRADYREDRDRDRREGDLRRADYLVDGPSPVAWLDELRQDSAVAHRQAEHDQAEVDAARELSRTAGWDERDRARRDRVAGATFSGRWLSGWQGGRSA